MEGSDDSGDHPVEASEDLPPDDEPTFMTDEIVSGDEVVEAEATDAEEEEAEEEAPVVLFHDFDSVAKDLEGRTELPRPHVTKEVIVRTLTALNATSGATTSELRETRDRVVTMKGRQDDLVESSALLKFRVGALDDAMAAAQHTLAAHEDGLHASAKRSTVDRLLEAVDKLSESNARKDKQIAALQALTQEQGSKLASLEATFLAQQKADREKAQGGPVFDDSVFIRTSQVFCDEDKNITLAGLLESIQDMNEEHRKVVKSHSDSLKRHAERHDTLAGKHDVLRVSSKLEATCTNLDELLHSFHQAGILEDKPKPIHHSDDTHPLPPNVFEMDPNAKDESSAGQTSTASKSGEEKTVANAEAKLAAEREARLDAEKEITARVALEAREAAAAAAEREHAAKLAAESEAKVAAEREAQAAAEREAKVEAEREAKVAAEREAKVAAEREAKVAAEREAQAAAEREAKVAAEREAKAKAEREIAESEAREAEEVAAAEAIALAEKKADADRLAALEEEKSAALKAEKPAALKQDKIFVTNETKQTLQPEAKGNAELESQGKSAPIPPGASANSPISEVKSGHAEGKLESHSQKSKKTSAIAQAFDKKSGAKPKLAGLISKMQKMGKFGVTNKLQVLEHRVGNDIAELRKSLEQLANRTNVMQDMINAKPTSADVDIKIESQFEEVIEKLQAAINTAGSDEAEFKRAAKELQGTVQQLMSTKADRSDLLLIKKRVSDESKVMAQLETLQAFVDGKLSREDAESMLDEKVERVELDHKLKRMRDTLRRVDQMATKLSDERAATPAWATGTGSVKRGGVACLSCNREMTAVQISTLQSRGPTSMGSSSLGPGGFALGGGFQVRPSTTPHRQRDEASSIVFASNNGAPGPQLFNRSTSQSSTFGNQPLPLPPSMQLQGRRQSQNNTVVASPQWSQGLLEQPGPAVGDTLPPVARATLPRAPSCQAERNSGAEAVERAPQGNTGSAKRYQPILSSAKSTPSVPSSRGLVEGRSARSVGHSSGLVPWTQDNDGVRTVQGRPSSRDESVVAAPRSQQQLKPPHSVGMTASETAVTNRRKKGPTAARMIPGSLDMASSGLIAQVKPKSHVLNL